MLSTSNQSQLQDSSQHQHHSKHQQAASMSYSYGPTVVYPSFSMGEPFGSGYDAKENCAALQGMHAVPVKEAFAVFEDSSCDRMLVQASSTSVRVPLGERQQNSTSTTSQQPAAKRAGGVPAPAPLPSKPVQQWEDIDENSKDNPLACSEYAQQIFEYLHSAELVIRPNPGYVANVQHDMSPHMRKILVDWLVEVAQEYRLTSDTLHLTVDLLNRFLSLEPVQREELQLAGIACMWIAAKFEEIYAPTAHNFCYITDNTYDQTQLVEMEARVLERLEFRLALPTAKTFQRRYLQAAAADEELHYLAAFLLELTLMDELLLKYLPSQLAAASVYLARAMLGRKPWDATLAHYSRYEEADVVPAVADLAFNHAHIQADGSFTAILEKYSSERLRQVASLPPFQALLPHSQSCKQYTQQQQAAAAANSSATDDNPLAGCFCSESSDMDLA